MPVLRFDKVKKARPSKVHDEMYQSDSGIRGTYVPNMSEEDQLVWKAKYIRGNDPRVEIRKTVTGPLVQKGTIRSYQGHAQILLIVRKPITAFKDEPFVEMSANGRMCFTLTDWSDLVMAVNEAWSILRSHDPDA